MIKVIFNEKQIADPGLQEGFSVPSPSAHKPKEVAAALKDVEFIDPKPVTIEDFKRVHDIKYVDDILNLKRKSGFNTLSQSVVDSLPYTSGAQYTAAKLAKVNEPTCALVSGFHHAGYDNWENFGWFCTFNGLMVAAAKLLAKDEFNKVAIIDCDMHWGNGTDDILAKKPEFKNSIIHITFGKHFYVPDQSDVYLSWLQFNGFVHYVLKTAKPDIIIYQAGADVHIDDPYGGILTTEQMYERDLRIFKIAKDLQIPITWNLAGGYQVEKDGSINKVIDLHLNTFKACKEAYND